MAKDIAKNVLELYRYLTNVKQEEYAWNLVDIACESSRTARDKEELSKILPKITKVQLPVYVKSGKVEFPRFWIDDYAMRTLVASVLAKLVIEDGFDYYDMTIDITTARLDSFINYSRMTFSENAIEVIRLRRYRLKTFVKEVINYLINKRILKLEGSKLYLNTDSITDIIEVAIEKASTTSPYFSAITRRLLTMGVLRTLGEVTESRVHELIHDLNKIVNAWPREESIAKDVNTIINEYIWFLHVLKLGDWYVWSKFKPLSKLLKEASELGIRDETIKIMHDIFMNVKAFSTELLGRLIHVADVDTFEKIKLIDLILKAINDIVKSGDYIFFQNLGLVVDSKTYMDIRNLIGNDPTIQRALDAIARIYDKLPIQKENVNIVNVVRNEIGKLTDELSEKIALPYDRFVREGNKDVKATLLQVLDSTGIIKYDIAKNIVEVLDPKALSIIAVLLGVRPLTILLRK